MTKKYIVEMPGDWDKDMPIDICPLLEHGCGEFGLCTRGCPLANAKGVTPIFPPENDYNLKAIKPNGVKSCRWEYHGKPVKLFAVEEP